MKMSGVKMVRVGGGMLLLSILSLASGCSSSSSVSGTVTYKGAPVKGGIVVFYGPSDWTGNSIIEEDGSYSIAGVPKGTIDITVDTRSAPGAPKGAGGEGGDSPFERFKAQGGGGMPKLPKAPADLPDEAKNNPLYGGGQANRYVGIPAKYANRERSGLTFESSGSKQIHDIRLE